MAYPILAPNQTWYKGTATRSTITAINIVDSYTVTGSENESWNADVDNTGAIKCYRTGTVLTIAGNGTGKIAANNDSSWMFSDSNKKDYFTALTVINGAEIIDTSNVTMLNRAFQWCAKLTTIDVSNWNTENVNTIECICQQCNALMTFDVSNWNTSNITNITAAFNKCYELTTLDVSGWDVSKVETAKMAFQACYKLTIIDVANWNVENITDMESMFQNCQALTTIDVSKWDVSSVTNMDSMFLGCQAITAIDVSNWDVSSVTNMRAMFNGCSSLTTLNVSNWDVSSVTDMSSMFSSGGSYGENYIPITSLDVSNWDVGNVTDMGWMFYGFKNVKTLDVTGWNVSNVESFHHFIAHSHLELIGLETWKVSNKCRTLNCMFHTCTNTTIDVTGWDVSSCKSFSQMFNYAAVEKIIGLETWDTSNGISFTEMFQDCAVRELDLSSFDTRKADSTQRDPDNNDVCGMGLMFHSDGTRPSQLEKITLGSNFSFNGNGSCSPVAILPEPDSARVAGADGKWYDIDGNAHTPAEVSNAGAGTYYASFDFTDGTYLVKGQTLLKLSQAIRSLTEASERITPNQMPSKVQEVYDKGYDIGYETGKSDGENSNTAFEDGKQAEYDRFWDSFQQNGNLRRYEQAFAAYGWNDETFKPKYDIIPSSGNYYIFQNAQITDLKKILEEQGVVFDTSRVGYALAWFIGSTITTVPELDLTGASTVIALQGASALKTVPKFILKKTGNQNFQKNNSFRDCTALEHIIFEGLITSGDLDLHWSPLDKESLTSVVNCLATTTENLTVTLSLNAVNKAFETSEGANDGITSTEWATLEGTKTNWTITLL